MRTIFFQNVFPNVFHIYIQCWPHLYPFLTWSTYKCNAACTYCPCSILTGNFTGANFLDTGLVSKNYRQHVSLNINDKVNKNEAKSSHRFKCGQTSVRNWWKGPQNLDLNYKSNPWFMFSAGTTEIHRAYRKAFSRIAIICSTIKTLQKQVRHFPVHRDHICCVTYSNSGSHSPSLLIISCWAC